MKIKHKVIYTNPDTNKETVLVEQKVEWKMTPDDLTQPINQMAVVEFEENLLKKHVRAESQLLSKD